MRRKDEKFDVYSFGICAWEIITLERPFENARFNSGIIQTWVLSGLRPALGIIPSEVPERIRNLIPECWGTVPDDRPSFTDIVSHCCETEEKPDVLNKNTNYYKTGMYLNVYQERLFCSNQVTKIMTMTVKAAVVV